MKKNKNIAERPRYAVHAEPSMLVYHEYDYEAFIKVENINRKVDAARVATMRDSINMLKTSIRPVVVAKMPKLGGDKWIIVDGQGLYEALRSMTWQIPYLVLNPRNTDELIMIMAFINTSNVKWQLYNYVHAWGYAKQEYIDLQDYTVRYSLRYAGLVAMAMNIHDIDQAAPIIKSGDFRITNTHFFELADIAVDLLMTEGLKGIGRLPNSLCVELVRYYDNIKHYNHATIKRRIKQNLDIIRVSSTKKSVVRDVLREKIFILP
jgi:hypothetical protein